MRNREKLFSKEEVFDRLREMGADKAVVSFSGGHDEGGVDNIRLYNGDQQILKIDDLYYTEEVYVRDENDNLIWEKNEELVRTSPKKRPATEGEKALMRLGESLSVPVYNKYYSFAGEFYVSGEVVWNAKTEKVHMTGEERVERYDGFEEEF